MRPIRRTLAALLCAAAMLSAPAALVATGTLSGCSTSSSARHDSAVATAEKSVQIAFETVDAFLAWEYANRAVAPEAARTVATELRAKAPATFRAAWAAIAEYKATRGASEATRMTARVDIALNLATNLPWTR